MSDSFKSMDVVNKFNEMIKKIEQLMLSIESNKNKIILPSWQDIPIKSTSPIDLLRYIYSDIWFFSYEDGRETRSYQGVILSNHETIIIAHELNNAKDEFHKSIIDYIGIDKNETKTKEIKKQISKSYQGRKKLSGLSLSRLNLKSCYRKLLIIDESVEKISYCQQTSSLSISKISVNKAMRQLENLEKKGWDVNFQIEKLKKIDCNEILAKIQKQAPIIKANIRVNGELSLTRKPSLPIIINCDSKIEINFLEPGTEKVKRASRSDKRISDIPFLPTIRIHRYNK